MLRASAKRRPQPLMVQSRRKHLANYRDREDLVRGARQRFLHCDGVPGEVGRCSPQTGRRHFGIRVRPTGNRLPIGPIRGRHLAHPIFR